ncbi:MAG: ABC transporter permease [Firmicutes bacterium]|nr:ABC transporter permease [Bacillota bacterium]
MLKLLEPVLFLYKHRSILWATTKTDIRTRFVGSIFGVLWLFLYPMLLLGAYAAVYIYVFNVRFQLFDSNEYVALIFCGLIPFLGFAETLGMGVGSVVANANLIKNTLFPIELVPVKAVLNSQCTQAAGLLILLVALGFLGKLSVWTPLFLLVWLMQIIFSIGLMWILASVNVFARDLQNVVSVLVLFLMMVSPIAYPADMIPEQLQGFLAFNPLYYIIIAFQDTMMLGRFPQGNIFWILSIFSIATFLIGFWFFKRMKRVFTDNV